MEIRNTSRKYLVLSGLGIRPFDWNPVSGGCMGIFVAVPVGERDEIELQLFGELRYSQFFQEKKEGVFLPLEP
jgi:hypothetical protein